MSWLIAPQEGSTANKICALLCTHNALSGSREDMFGRSCRCNGNSHLVISSLFFLFLAEGIRVPPKESEVPTLICFYDLPLFLFNFTFSATRAALVIKANASLKSAKLNVLQMASRPPSSCRKPQSFIAKTKTKTKTRLVFVRSRRNFEHSNQTSVERRPTLVQAPAACDLQQPQTLLMLLGKNQKRSYIRGESRGHRVETH